MRLSLFLIICLAVSSSDIEDPNPIICYNENYIPIRDTSRREDCVFTPLKQVNWKQGEPPVNANPDCKKRGICVGGCYKSNCLKLGYARGLLAIQTQNCLKYLFWAIVLSGLGVLVLVVTTMIDNRKLKDLVKVYESNLKNRSFDSGDSLEEPLSDFRRVLSSSLVDKSG